MPVQHREVEGVESEEFLECFPRGITYLEGGVESGFRKVSEDDDDYLQIKKLYRVRKEGSKPVRCFEVPLKCSSLDDGDAFVLDAGKKIYTWFGKSVSPFEKNKSATVAHNLRENRLGDGGGRCDAVFDVQDDDEEFWALLGGKGKIRPAQDSVGGIEQPSKMYIVSDDSGIVKVKEVPLVKTNLQTESVCLIDVGKNVFVWIGKESSTEEKQQAMVITNRYLKAMGRTKTTCVGRVMEGRERRTRAFKKAFEIKV